MFSPGTSGQRAAQAGAAAPLATRAARRAALQQARRRRCAAAAEADSAAAAVPSAPSAPGRMTYRPESYNELVGDAAAALLKGVEAGLTRMEVEFPPIPTNIDGEAPRDERMARGPALR